MLRKAFQQLRNVEIDWDLQLHIVHVRSLTQREPKISLRSCFCRGGEGSVPAHRPCGEFLPVAGQLPSVALCPQRQH